MENQREWTIGAQVLRFEPPDVLWVEFREKLSLEEAIQLVGFYRELSRSGPFFLVVDLRDVPLSDPEVQRYFGEQVEPAWVHANIFIGARLAHKAVARGIYVAAWLTGRADASVQSKNHFVSTPAEASALVARLRARYGGKVA